MCLMHHGWVLGFTQQELLAVDKLYVVVCRFAATHPQAASLRAAQASKMASQAIAIMSSRDERRHTIAFHPPLNPRS
jgi:hypothetical protein